MCARGAIRCISVATGTTSTPRFTFGSWYNVAIRCETISGCGLNTS